MGIKLERLCFSNIICNDLTAWMNLKILRSIYFDFTYRHLNNVKLVARKYLYFLFFL